MGGGGGGECGGVFVCVCGGGRECGGVFVCVCVYSACVCLLDVCSSSCPTRMDILYVGVSAILAATVSPHPLFDKWGLQIIDYKCSSYFMHAVVLFNCLLIISHRSSL